MIPVYQGYPSQYGHGLGNVLGGVFRAALPIVKSIAKQAAPVVKNVAKRAGSELLESGIKLVQKKMKKSKPVKRATSRPVQHIRRQPPGKPVRRSTRKTKARDIFSA